MYHCGGYFQISLVCHRPFLHTLVLLLAHTFLLTILPMNRTWGFVSWWFMKGWFRGYMIGWVSDCILRWLGHMVWRFRGCIMGWLVWWWWWWCLAEGQLQVTWYAVLCLQGGCDTIVCHLLHLGDPQRVCSSVCLRWQAQQACIVCRGSGRGHRCLPAEL